MAFAVVSAACGAAPAREHAEAPSLVTGIAVGEIDADGFVIWGRADRPATLHVRVGEHAVRAAVEAELDLTGRATLEGLPPGEHRYEVWITEPNGAPRGAAHASGRVRLAPAADVSAAVRLSWTGDVAGQNVCRDVQRGLGVLEAIDVTGDDFTIALGDWIYADYGCEAQGRFGNAQVAGGFGPASDLESFRAHWRYAEADRGYAAFRARTYAVWDDHEVTNDFGQGEPLYASGRRAYLEHSPLGLDPRDEAAPLWRSSRWGRHLELVLLDLRSHRDPRGQRDEDGAPKTMLGARQRVWLEELLSRTDATWVVIASSVPLAIPTGYPVEAGRDGWADHGSGTGYERELVSLLRLAAERRLNLVFITTDVHFATVVRYTPFPEVAGFHVHEIVSGPASAGLFPNRELDGTLHPEALFFHGPDDPESVRTLEQAMPYFTYARIAIDEHGALTAEIANATQVLYRLALAPPP